MSRYVITPDIAIRLAESQTELGPGVNLVAPTLLPSQVLSTLYRRFRDGDLTQADADAHLEFIRGLRIRLLGDRVLQAVAWSVGVELDAEDTLTTEYIALTKLQADSLVTGDVELSRTASELVPVASIDDLGR